MLHATKVNQIQKSKYLWSAEKKKETKIRTTKVTKFKEFDRFDL